MKANDLIHEFNARFKKITRYYERLPEKFDAEDIHHFRVEVKKLRAFMRLVNLAQPDHQHTIPKEIKKFYRLVGNVRNLQLQRQRVLNLCKELKLENPEFYIEYLQEREQTARQRAEQITKEISFHQLEKKLIGAAPDDLSQGVSDIYVQKSRLRFENLLTLAYYQDENLHEFQKVLKDLLFNYSKVQSAFAVHMPVPLDDLKTTEALSKALGNFHDLCVAVLLLSPIYVSQITQTANSSILDREMNALTQLEAQLRFMKERLKAEIFEMLRPVKVQIEKERHLLQSYEIL